MNNSEDQGWIDDPVTVDPYEHVAEIARAKYPNDPVWYGNKKTMDWLDYQLKHGKLSQAIAPHPYNHVYVITGVFYRWLIRKIPGVKFSFIDQHYYDTPILPSQLLALGAEALKTENISSKVAELVAITSAPQPKPPQKYEVSRRRKLQAENEALKKEVAELKRRLEELQIGENTINCL